MKNTPWKASVDGRGAVEIDSSNLDLQLLPDGTYSYIAKNGSSHTIEVVDIDKRARRVNLLVDGRPHEVQLQSPLDQLVDELGLEANPQPVLTEIHAPMPGLVLRVEVAPGEEVEADQTLFVLEAMKMENAIKAPAAATVERVVVATGDAVEKGALLVSFVRE